MNRSYGGLCGLAILMAMVTLSCTAGISEESRSQVNYMGTFQEVQVQPEKYKGDTVMWGGKIVETKPGDNDSEIVVLQLALGGQDRPQNNDDSKGRFIARTTQFLDPALFPSGTLVTVVGRIQGAEERLIGQMTYQYPVVGIVEVKKWPIRDDASPRFHFGIGVGTRF